MKMKLKEIKSYVTTGSAIDLTRKAFDVGDIRAQEGGFVIVAFATGVYGYNGALVRGRKSGNLYAVTSRNSVLFHLL